MRHGKALVLAAGLLLCGTAEAAKPKKKAAGGRKIERLGTKASADEEAQAGKEKLPEVYASAKEAFEKLHERCEKRMKHARKPAAVYEAGVTVKRPPKDDKPRPDGSYDEGGYELSVTPEGDAKKNARTGKCPDKPKDLDFKDGDGKFKFPIVMEPPPRRDDPGNDVLEPGMQ